jgi:hypothetical protein
MAGLPMRCHRCGVAWFQDNFIHVEGGGSVTVTGSSFVTNCPKCGAKVTKSGSWEVTSQGWRPLLVALRTPSARREDYEALAAMLRSAQQSERSRDELAADIKSSVPTLGGVADFIKALNTDRIATWIVVILTVITFILTRGGTADRGSSSQSGSNVQIVQPTEAELQQAIEMALANAEGSIPISTSGSDRNQPCHCGSGVKFTKCHGSPGR